MEIILSAPPKPGKNVQKQKMEPEPDKEKLPQTIRAPPKRCPPMQCRMKKTVPPLETMQNNAFVRSQSKRNLILRDQHRRFSPNVEQNGGIRQKKKAVDVEGEMTGESDGGVL